MSPTLTTVNRRRLLQLGGATAAAALLAPRQAAAAPFVAANAAATNATAATKATAFVAPDPAEYRTRAVAAYNAMQGYLYAPPAADGTDTGLYKEETSPALNSGARPYSYLWPFTRAHAGTLDLYGPAADRLTGLAKYWDGTGYASYVVALNQGGGDRFYDDNAWSGLNLMRAHRLTPGGNAVALARAKAVFKFINAGWDTNRKHPAPGGVFWVQASWSRDRNTCSNAPSAELGLRLYQATARTAADRKAFLTPATDMYAWVDRYLRSDGRNETTAGLYWDHIDLNGNIEKTQWSYNQGTMIGAGVLLARETGDGSYLARALSTAGLALDHYARVGYFTQEPAFNAIFFRNLLLLASADAQYLEKTLTAMQGYVDQAYAQNRGADGLYYFPAGDTSARLLDQGAMVEILACLATAAAQYDTLV